MIVITVARKPMSEGTVAANVLAVGTGALNIDATRVGTYKNTTPSGMDRYNARLQEQGYRPGAYAQGTPEPPSAVGRWPANLILGCPVASLDTGEQDDSGRVSRFFKQVGGNS